MENDHLISGPPTPGHVDRLPAEILATVFLYVRWDKGPDGREYLNSFWIRVMLVCRRWRQIGVDTAALWSSFYLWGLTAEALKLHMQRSKTAPLVIWLSTGDVLFNTVQPWLTTQRARIQYLQVYNFYGTKEVAFCRELLSYELPMVATLNLQSGSEARRRGERFPTFPPSQASRFPNLRKLQLVGWEVGHGFDISELSSLMLSECKLETWAGDSLDRFVDILATCPGLGKLEFSYCSFSPAFLADPPPPSSSPLGRIVSFPRLAEFTFRTSLRAGAAILSYIHIPPTARVTLQGSPDPDSPQEYESLDLLDRRTLPILACCTTVSVNDSTYGGSDAINGGSITVHVGGEGFACSMRGCTHFTYSSVVRLSIRAQNMADAPEYLYLAVLDAFPLLETIDLATYRADVGMFVALCTESWVRPGQGVCARLRRLELGACQPSIALLETLEGCARLRYECGLRVSQVVLRLAHVIDRLDSPRLRPDGSSSVAPGLGASSNDSDDGNGDDDDAGVDDSEEGFSGEEDSEDSSDSTGGLLGTRGEFDYWKGEFVARLSPFVDEIVYERAYAVL